MKLLVVAGGGGHFAAALSVLQQIPKDWEVLIVGRKYSFEADKTLSFEYKTAQNLGLRFESITTGRLQRKLSFQSLNIFAKMPIGILQAIKVIKNFKPDVVVSFGGYVSLPICFIAKSFNIPIIVHEQTFTAGLANKIVSKFAEKICISWEDSRKYFPKDKVVFTGNPLKKNEGSNSQFNIPDEKLPVIYVTGGSSGAHAINVLIEEIIEKLLVEYIVIHQTGDAKKFGDFDRLSQKKKSLSKDLQKRYALIKFIEAGQVFSVLEKADLVISRSGINSVTEIIHLGKPALFIPLPFGQRNEQLTNAQFVKKIGLAEIAQQKDLTGDKLLELIKQMLKNIDLYKNHAIEAKKFIQKEAAEKIISVIVHVNQQKKT